MSTMTTDDKPRFLDAWMDRNKDRVGCEISFDRYFYLHATPRSFVEIDADWRPTEHEIVRLLQEVRT